VDSQNRRGSPRVRVDTWSRLHVRQAKLVQAMPYMCRVHDLSAEGMRFETDLKLKDNGSFTMSLHLPSREEPLELYGDIVWSRQLANGRYLYGARVYNTELCASLELGESVAHLLKIHDKEE